MSTPPTPPVPVNPCVTPLDILPIPHVRQTVCHKILFEQWKQMVSDDIINKYHFKYTPASSPSGGARPLDFTSDYISKFDLPTVTCKLWDPNLNVYVFNETFHVMIYTNTQDYTSKDVRWCVKQTCTVDAVEFIIEEIKKKGVMVILKSLVNPNDPTQPPAPEDTPIVVPGEWDINKFLYGSLKVGENSDAQSDPNGELPYGVQYYSKECIEDVHTSCIKFVDCLNVAAQCVVSKIPTDYTDFNRYQIVTHYACEDIPDDLNRGQVGNMFTVIANPIWVSKEHDLDTLREREALLSAQKQALLAQTPPADPNLVNALTQAITEIRVLVGTPTNGVYSGGSVTEFEIMSVQIPDMCNLTINNPTDAGESPLPTYFQIRNPQKLGFALEFKYNEEVDRFEPTNVKIYHSEDNTETKTKLNVALHLIRKTVAEVFGDSQITADNSSTTI